MDLDSRQQSDSRVAASPVWWRRRRVQLLAAAVAAGVGIGTYFAVGSSGPGTIDVHGTLRLGPLSAVDEVHSFGTAEDGDVCVSGSGYDDITAGAAVTVGGPTGQTLAVAPLSGGAEDGVADVGGAAMGFCVFSFDATVSAGQSAYTVTIGHRGTQTFTPAQVGEGIQLKLGD